MSTPNEKLNEMLKMYLSNLNKFIELRVKLSNRG